MQDLSANSSKWWLLLNARRLPARLTAEDVASLGGFQVHDIPVIVRAHLLEPLGSGAKNSVKYFASRIVLEKINDPKWLDRATKAVSRCKSGRQVAQVRSGSAVKLVKQQANECP